MLDKDYIQRIHYRIRSDMYILIYVAFNTYTLYHLYSFLHIYRLNLIHTSWYICLTCIHLLLYYLYIHTWYRNKWNVHRLYLIHTSWYKLYPFMYSFTLVSFVLIQNIKIKIDTDWFNTIVSFIFICSYITYIHSRYRNTHTEVDRYRMISMLIHLLRVYNWYSYKYLFYFAFIYGIWHDIMRLRETLEKMMCFKCNY